MIVELKHKDSKMSIHVPEAQVKTAEFYGWFRADKKAETSKSTKPKKRGKKVDG